MNVVFNKNGHKYYGIKRKDVQINSVLNIMYNRNNNYDTYKSKISQVIKDKILINLVNTYFYDEIVWLFKELFDAIWFILQRSIIIRIEMLFDVFACAIDLDY